MYVKIRANIVITRASDGKTIRFSGFSSIEAVHDIFKINSSAKISIPLSARLNYKDTRKPESVQTANVFSRGDKVEIWLGYDDDLKLEFTGFIKRVNFTKPLEIECEGFEYLLREAVKSKSWKSVSLTEVLQYIIEGTGIALRSDIPEMTFDKFVIGANLTRLEALQQVKEQYGLTVTLWNNEMYAGLAYTRKLATVKYRLGENTIKDNELKYRIADDVKLKVKAVWVRPDNTKVEVEVGDSAGSQRTLFFYNVSSEDELKRIAAEEVQKYRYSGYEGKITTFLQPFALPFMAGEIEDVKYPERSGTYYITKTTVKADSGGARRTVEFTVKL